MGENGTTLFFKVLLPQTQGQTVLDVPYSLYSGEGLGFRGGLVFQAHRLLYHSTLGLTVIKKKKRCLGVTCIYEEAKWGLRLIETEIRFRVTGF